MSCEKEKLSVDDHCGDAKERWLYSYSTIPRVRETTTKTETSTTSIRRADIEKETEMEMETWTTEGKQISDVPTRVEFETNPDAVIQYWTPDRDTIKLRRDVSNTIPPIEHRDGGFSAMEHDLGRPITEEPLTSESEHVRNYNTQHNDNILSTHLTSTRRENIVQTPVKGDLDNFLSLNDTTVRGVTVQAMSSPDKTASTVSWSASPDVVADFPGAKSRSASLNPLQRPCHPKHSVSLPNKQELCLVAQEEKPNEMGKDVAPSLSQLSVPNTSSSAAGGVASRDLLRIQIETSRTSKDDSNQTSDSHTFYLPVSLMLQREIEMQEAARINRIGQDRWSTSRIFRMWRKQQRERNKLNASSTTEMTIHLTPEVSLQNSSRSCSPFRWKSWLTTCIRAFYNTGSLRIPDSCQGDDILLALEYFGILTASAEMFVFESALAFERIQSWSRYFTFRTELAETLLEAYDDAEEQEQQQRSVVGDGNEEDEIDYDRARALFLRSSAKARIWVLEEQEERLLANPAFYVDGIAAKSLPVRTEGGLYRLFSEQKFNIEDLRNRKYDDEDEDFQSTQRLPNRLRLDFCEYVLQSLPPRTAIHFNLENVEIIASPLHVSSRSSRFELKPVIRIEPASNKTVHNSLIKASTFESFNAGLMTEIPERSIRSVSMGSTRSRVDPIAASKASSAGSGGRWKMSESSTHNSPHTKTLAGEGISPVTTDVYGNHSPLAQKVLFLEEILHQQPRLHDEGQASQELNFRIPQRRMLEDPTSPTSIRVFRGEDTGQTSANAFDTRHREEEKKAMKCRADREAAPITYINTELGDLRSVTSVLSEPVIDIPGVVCGMKASNPRLSKGIPKQDEEMVTGEAEDKEMLAEAARRIIQNRICKEAGSSERRITKLTSPPEKQPLDEQQTKPNCGASSVIYDSVRDAEVAPSMAEWRDVAAEQEEMVDLQHGANEQHRDVALDTRSAIPADDPFGSWGHVLASVCEAVTPAPSSNNGSSSPTRAFSVTLRNGQLVQQPMESTKEIDDQPFAGCPCRQDPSTALEEEAGTSSWIPANSVPDVVKEETLGEKPTHDEFLDRARQMGIDISNQFDAFMKMAFDATMDVQQASKGFLATIPEEMPEISLAVSEKPLEITTKKKPVSNDPYAIPKSQSFDSDVLAEASVPLPPHQPRRLRSKMTVARKKNSPNRPQPIHSKKNKGYPSHDYSVSSLSEVSSRRVSEQHRDDRKMLT
ncbi:hypothetical protein IV203_019600 [Nitzschia inconspicua]|uniref:Uncharacterized protein n=1 Tax=Nitzschia inconspicua TaxID=303405 RepID=A0A9K3LZ02_9STRA|nr:hypothetical protein IV203_019600 [Nitzschia inconspicua]